MFFIWLENPCSHKTWNINSNNKTSPQWPRKQSVSDSFSQCDLKMKNSRNYLTTKTNGLCTKSTNETFSLSLTNDSLLLTSHFSIFLFSQTHNFSFFFSSIRGQQFYQIPYFKLDLNNKIKSSKLKFLISQAKCNHRYRKCE